MKQDKETVHDSFSNNNTNIKQPETYQHTYKQPFNYDLAPIESLS